MEECKRCHKHFRGNYELREHIAIQHKGERWSCEEDGCRKEYKSYNGYRYHLVKSHNLLSKHVCTTCNKPFATKDDLMNHERSLHNASKLSCARCKSTFTFKNNLIRHQKKCRGISNKKLNCFACGKAFKKTKYLIEHIKGQHTPPRYQCDICKLKFSYRSLLKSHVKKKHAGRLEVCN